VKKLWFWVSTRFWPFLVKVGKAVWKIRKPILWAAGIVAAVLFGRRVVAFVMSAVIGKAYRQDQFRRVDDDHIEIKAQGGWYPVDLTTIRAGKRVKAGNVTAAQYRPGQAAVVEVDNHVLAGG
jgi:hypothetical protein